ncbi:MAG: hypothetical protein ACI4AD_03285, partial [Roseburia sp.]
MKVHRKGIHNKLKKECKGVVSIFLCLILSPLLMLASALVEYARYQENAQMVQEVINCASYSTLADYDEYLQKRFGLFALEQDGTIENSYKVNLKGCMSVLAKMVTVDVDSSTADGVYPLSNSYVLKQQILDFSENTVMAEFLLEGLKLQELLDKLNNLKGLEELKKAAEKVAKATESIETLVEKGSKLADQLTSIVSDMKKIQSDSDTLLATFSNLSKKLRDAGYTGGSVDDDSLEDILESYYSDIAGIYEKANVLYSDIDNLLQHLEGVPELAQEVKSAFDDAQDALGDAESNTAEGSPVTQETKSEGKESTLADSSEKATDVLGAIIDAMDSAVEEAANTLKDTTVNGIKAAAETLKDELYDNFSLNKYSGLSGYFSTPMSQEAKDDLKTIIGTIPASWDDSNPTACWESLKAAIKAAYFPDNIDFSSLDAIKSSTGNIVSDAVANAKQKLNDSLQAGLSEMFTALVTAIRNLFKLDIFCNADLNANLSDATVATLLTSSVGSTNPYSTMLTAMKTLFDAVDDFSDSVENLNITGVLKAVAKLMKAIA